MPTNRTKIALAAAVAAVTLAATACGGGGGNSGTGGDDEGTPHKGGTLKLIGNGDVDHLDTVSGYYTTTFTLQRAFTRQLYTYPNKPTLEAQETPVPDLATAQPEYNADRTKLTIHIRKGAMWDTKPPRQVTAQDAIRGFKRMCNPVMPTGAPGYYTDTIVGMADFCDAFAKVPGKVPAMKKFIQTHDIKGLTAKDDLTLQITLTQPASDMTNILAEPFASPAPVEYLDYMPDGPQFRQNTISDGPYSITSYEPKKHITLERNPAWKASSDPIRKAYVDKIEITEGVPDASTALQRIQAGTEDMFWDQIVPTAQLAGLRAQKDPGLLIGPSGNNFYSINPYIAINMQSPNNNGALGKLKVRQALEYAFNKAAVAQVYGGTSISKPLNQPIPGGSIGHIDGFNPYQTPGDKGDPAKAKQLLKEAGYQPGQITLKLIYRTNSVHPQVAQTNQAALEKAGFKVKLIPVTPADAFYTQYLQNPDASKRGAWDVAAPGWIPDWMGNNGRAVIEPLFDGRHYGPNSTDYGAYNNDYVNSQMDAALQAPDAASASKHWQNAMRQVMKDAVIVPLNAQKIPMYHSKRLHGCNFLFFNTNCDIPNVWIQ